MRIWVEDLKKSAESVLMAIGVPIDDARIISGSIIYAHKREKHTHGIGRLPIYVRKIKSGLMNARTPMTVVADSMAMTVFDAENGFGQVAAIRGMDAAIERAETYGISAVGIRNSNNFGAAGFIGEYATGKNKIALVCSNSGPAISPTGGKTAILGTNPICVAFPGDESDPPIIFDMACSVAARGKVRLAAKNGERIPIGWAVDEHGRDTDDPQDALKGSMVPIGGYKGFGLALCVDLAAGLLTGSAFGGAAKNLNHPTEISRYGHFMIAVNPKMFLSGAEYDARIRKLIENIKASGDPETIRMPGETSYRKAQINKESVEISDKLVTEFNHLAKSLRADVLSEAR